MIKILIGWPSRWVIFQVQRIDFPAQPLRFLRKLKHHKYYEESLHGSLYPLPFGFHTRGHMWNWLKSTDLNLTLHLRPRCATLFTELNIWSHAESQSCRLKQLAARIPCRFGLTARCEPGWAGGDICIVSKGDACTCVLMCKHEYTHTTCNYHNHRLIKLLSHWPKIPFKPGNNRHLVAVRKAASNNTQWTGFKSVSPGLHWKIQSCVKMLFT